LLLTLIIAMPASAAPICVKLHSVVAYDQADLDIVGAVASPAVAIDASDSSFVCSNLRIGFAIPIEQGTYYRVDSAYPT
jgi:hypothetical protein